MRGPSTPRWINVTIGVWLFLSAFFWPHTEAQYANSLVVGAAIVTTAAIALRIPSVRYANVALGLWLLMSSWFFPTLTTGTLWNNLLVSVAVLITAFQPNQRQPAYR